MTSRFGHELAGQRFDSSSIFRICSSHPAVIDSIGCFIGVRAGGAGGAAAPPVSKIFGQNAKNSGNKETINDGIEK